MLLEELQASKGITKLSNYMTTGYSFNPSDLSETECNEIVDLFDRYTQTQQALAECDAGSDYFFQIDETLDIEVQCKQKLSQQKFTGDTEEIIKRLQDEWLAKCKANPKAVMDSWNSGPDKTKAPCGYFPTLNMAKNYGRDVYSCTGASGECLNVSEIGREISVLNGIFTSKVTDVIIKGEKSNMVKSVATGAAIGAGTGAVATAITAMVEHSNINCRLGDGLAQVGLGKAYSIETLRDFYVKWNLNLPDTVSPTAQINDCASWRDACSKFTYAEDCKNAQVNYRPSADVTTTLIRSACAVSGSTCIENYPVARSYGVCE